VSHPVSGAHSDADVASYAIDTSTGNDCARWGTLVVTPSNDFQSHTLNVDLPICGASVGSVNWVAIRWSRLNIGTVQVRERPDVGFKEA
jgi:hypothetical protein